jgi:hypothetical protein
MVAHQFTKLVKLALWTALSIADRSGPSHFALVRLNYDRTWSGLFSALTALDRHNSTVSRLSGKWSSRDDLMSNKKVYIDLVTLWKHWHSFAYLLAVVKSLETSV